MAVSEFASFLTLLVRPPSCCGLAAGILYCTRQTRWFQFSQKREPGVSCCQCVLTYCGASSLSCCDLLKDWKEPQKLFGNEPAWTNPELVCLSCFGVCVFAIVCLCAGPATRRSFVSSWLHGQQLSALCSYDFCLEPLKAGFSIAVPFFSCTWQIPCILFGVLRFLCATSMQCIYANSCPKVFPVNPGKVNDSLDGPALGALWGLLPAGRSKSVQVGMFPA